MILNSCSNSQVWDTLLTRYPEMVVVWAHLGLSKVTKYSYTYLILRHKCC